MDSDSEFGTESDFYAGDLILRISYVRETEWLNLAEFPIGYELIHCSIW